ncbi:MAG: hypothetical protein K5849_05650 [Bacteroidales bacterium]|nr:hypothetical protein [Bacteroidales bacterium]
MDLELLSRMVGELIIGHDQVGLPGVGTFVAEMVPASFSDKGFIINPPYRRLSFRPEYLEDSLLIDFYASSNLVDREAAGIYLTQYLAELKAVLEERKTVTLPGLGRLRATRENALFFVPDEGLDIFPAGIGLRPVSLKSHMIQEDPVVINVPLPIRPEIPAPEPEPVPEPEPLPETDQEPEFVPEPEPVPEPEQTPEPEDAQTAAFQPEPAEIPVAEPAVPETEPLPEAEQAEEPAEEAEELPEAEAEELPEAEAVPEPDIHKKGMPWWVVTLLALIILAVLALIIFVILAHVAPDYIDSILYTPEELRIINY